MPPVPTPLPADEILDPLEAQDLEEATDAVDEDEDPITDEEVAQEVEELRKAFDAVAPDALAAIPDVEDDEDEEDEAALLNPDAAPAPKRTKGSAISQELIDAPLTMDDLFDKGAL